MTLARVLTLALFAQYGHATALVPLYRPADVVTGLYEQWAAHRSSDLRVAATRLERALQAFCDARSDLEEARSGWTQALAAWERLSAVPFGPLIERRSVRQIDFSPTRPNLIARAIERSPKSAAEMERIGAPAKGFPALEWLLWTKPVAPSTPACAYAVQVGADIAREAAALSSAFHEGARKAWEEDAADAAFSEFVNQWVGALERLRWQQIERPRRQGSAFPRAASGGTGPSWARQWQALRELAVASGGVVPVETYLRGRGLTSLADQWTRRVSQTDKAMRSLRPAERETLAAAARELASLRELAAAEVAPALNISIGFSDADGD